MESEKSRRARLAVQSVGSAQAAAAEEATRRGVALAQEPLAPPARSPMPGWVHAAMPAAAVLLEELKAACGPEVWPGVAENLRKGRGYAVDLTTNIALGWPPLDLWQRGRDEKRDGFTVMRVRSLRP